MIVGTAGHVDHGKTTLVRALTGIDTDRLPEEKRRGMTLEPGFAHLEVPGHDPIAVIDVPGHERFLKSMAAGVFALDVALLVIASDEGVCPQTREHLDVLSLLGVPRLIVVFSKCELLAPLGEDWKAMLLADVAALLEKTPFGDSPRLWVSAQRGDGMADLIALLVQGAAQAPRAVEGPAFLPVDRAFSVKGFGTVVTGTLLRGTLAVDDEVSLVPRPEGVLRVRGLQVHGAQVKTARARTRVAVNVTPAEAKEISRGAVLVAAGSTPAARVLDVEISLLPDAPRPLPRRFFLHLCLGATQTEAAFRLLDVDELAPGQSAVAQATLNAAVGAKVHQRFIALAPESIPTRGRTVAGGRVLVVNPRRRKRSTAAGLTTFLDAPLEEGLAWVVADLGYAGATPEELSLRVGASRRDVDASLERLSARGQVVCVDKKAKRYVAAQALESVVEKAKALLQRFHQKTPDAAGLPVAALTSQLQVTPAMASLALGRLQKAGVAVLGEESVRLADFSPRATLDVERATAALVARLEASGLHPPSVKELEAEFGASLPGALRQLLESARVVKSGEFVFAVGPVRTLEARLREFLGQAPDITPVQFKDLAGESRKYAIPLLEYFDREKVTLRVGDKRVLRKR